jgi:SAM-dependent methyltransferase
MEAAREGQVSRSAADVYEEFFVPALFAEWVEPVADAGRLANGHRVLDIACGTGVLAREASSRVCPHGSVVGLDRNEGMLAVARRHSVGIEWRLGRAEALPFADGCFDAVISQFGLMFFEDRVGALREMWRVLRRGGRMAVAVWDTLDHAPGYAAMTALLQRLFGNPVADALRAPYALGDRESLLSLFAEAGIPGPGIATHVGTATFPSIESWVHTDVKGWTLADLIDDGQYQTLRREAVRDLQAFVRPDGTVTFPHPAHIVTAAKP